MKLPGGQAKVKKKRDVQAEEGGGEGRLGEWEIDSVMQMTSQELNCQVTKLD